MGIITGLGLVVLVRFFLKATVRGLRSDRSEQANHAGLNLAPGNSAQFTPMRYCCCLGRSC